MHARNLKRIVYNRRRGWVITPVLRLRLAHDSGGTDNTATPPEFPLTNQYRKICKVSEVDMNVHSTT
jgi:hypothetical protein